MVAGGLLFGLAIASQARVQLFGSADIKAKAEKSKRFVVTHVDRPSRGTIYSADGKILARDNGVYRLHLNVDRSPKSPAFYMEVGNAAGMSGAEVRELAEQQGGDLLWPPVLSADQRRKVDAVRVKWRADGLSADPTGERSYPLGAAASGVIGLIGTEETSKGIEKSLGPLIAGRNGVQRGLVDRTGAFLPMRMEDDTIARVDGKDIVLTLDSNIQTVAFDSVKRAVESNKADSGIAIVMDPRSGDVLAMANWPTFDPATGQGPDHSVADFNPNFMGHFEPGSTMKILTQAKALEDGKIGLDWHSQCNGILQKGPYRVRCALHNGNRAHGAVNLERAIAVSCNVSAAQWATMIGFEPYRQFIHDLGLLDELNVDLPNTKPGSIYIEEVAKTQELMCWGFGQSLNVTPLALAAAFTSLGNNGVWMKPRLVKSVGGIERPTMEGKRVFSSKTTAEVLKCMEAVIDTDHGTGKTLRIPGLRAAGKTGTAQRLGRGQGYVSNFVGILPADNPQAVVLVMIDHPSGSQYYGAQVAGPVYKEIAQTLARKMKLRSTSASAQLAKAEVSH
jgi:cell division protein FtsI/penicillin-binding protein 2